MDNIVIRKARFEDCEKLSYLKRDVWETTYRGIYPDERLDNYDYEKNTIKFQELVNNENVQIYVVEDNNIIVGYIEFGVPIRPFSDFKQEIGLFYIRKDYQRKGIGRKLFNLAYSYIQSTGADKFFISCNKRNINGQKFYTKMGGNIIHVDDDSANDNQPQVKFEYVIKKEICIENKKDEEIINKLVNVLGIKYECHKYFNDGVSSRVILLNNCYLIKQNTKTALQAEVEFLKLNTSDYFQEIVYIEPNYEFVAYNFIHGDVMQEVDDVEDTIKKLVNITSNYASYKKEGFGYLNEEVTSWSQFLKNEIKYSSNNITEYISDSTIANDCVEILEKYPFDKKLLHGDFGTHNFIKQNGKFIGVIDPMPVIGDPLYDLLFAIVSNTDILSNITLNNIYSLINEPQEKIKALLTIVIYSRISRCLKYHPKDIDIYMNFWYTLTK